MTPGTPSPEAPYAFTGKGRAGQYFYFNLEDAVAVIGVGLGPDNTKDYGDGGGSSSLESIDVESGGSEGEGTQVRLQHLRTGKVATAILWYISTPKPGGVGNCYGAWHGADFADGQFQVGDELQAETTQRNECGAWRC